MRFTSALGFLIGATGIAAAEKYWLVHVLDNDETAIRKGLTQEECRRLKEDFLKSKIIVVEASAEDPRLGTLTCLPEGDF